MRVHISPCIARTIGELNEELGWKLSAPDKDRTGCFPERGIQIAFQGFNEGLDTLRGKLGEVRYVKTGERSDRMRVAPK